MRCVIALTVALCSLTSVQQILAQDARSNIEKAVTAHGGEAKLASLRRVKFEMEVNITAPQDKTAPPRKALSVGIQGTVKGDAISVVVTLKNPEGEEVGVMATEGKGG